MTQLLNAEEIQSQLATLTGWNLVGEEIQSVRKFQDFVEAIDFINKLVQPAEAAGHHPDLAISWNKVTITLSTHDAGGLTQKDFNLAQIINQIS
jgi:4a-hydroxytetrahydrobiopterin dehydratase